MELTAQALGKAGLVAAAALDRQGAAPFLRGEAPPFGGVIVALFPYYAGRQAGNLSLYARGEDYHAVLRRRLTRAAGLLGLSAVPYADLSPFDEVGLAAAAGLGGIGQNGLLMNKPFGSFCFIGELLTKEELTPLSGGLAPACTGCGRCAALCPTGALQGGGVRVERCLSHITQARRLTAEQRALLGKSALVWGCDLCQLCCPANAGLDEAALPEFSKELLHSLTAQQLEGLSDRAFRRRFEGRAFVWRGVAPLRRNLGL